MSWWSAPSNLMDYAYLVQIRSILPLTLRSGSSYARFQVTSASAMLSTE